MPVLTANILSNPTQDLWSQVYTFALESPNNQSQQVVVVSIKKPKPTHEPATKIGKQVLQAFEQEFLKNSAAGNPLKFLENVIKQTKNLFPQLEISLALLSCQGNRVYLASSGNAQVCVFKNGNLSRIKKDKDPLILVGEPQNEDLFLLGTNEFFLEAESENLEKILKDHTSLPEKAEAGTLLVHKNNNPLASGALVVFKKPALLPIERQPQPKIQIPKPKFSLPSVKKIAILFAKKLPERYVRPRIEGGSAKRNALVVGGIFLILLLVSTIFGIRQKSVNTYKSTYKEELTNAQNLFENSLLQKDVNPEMGRQLFVQSQRKVEELLSRKIEDKDLKSLAQELKNREAEILGVVKSEGSLFLELSLLRSDVEAEDISLEGDVLAVLDKKGERIIEVETLGKKTAVLGGSGKMPKPGSITTYAKDFYVLTENGIVKLEKNGNTKLAVEKGGNWQEAFKIKSFAGNLYLLTTQGNILRYPRLTDGTFGPEGNWLSESTKVGFQPVDWAVDGSIWLLSPEGKVNKFTRGAPEGFNIKGDVLPNQTKAIYTDENMDSIYILDNQNGQIIEIDKGGEYKKQYLSEDIKKAQDFAVSKNQGKIFLLTPTQILEIPLS